MARQKAEAAQQQAEAAQHQAEAAQHQAEAVQLSVLNKVILLNYYAPV